jgi:hypothetical protein
MTASVFALAGRRARSGLLAACGFAVLLGISAGPAAAAKEKRRVPYQVTITEECEQAFCDYEIGTVGDRERIYIDNVACFINSSSRGTIRFFGIVEAHPFKDNAGAEAVSSEKFSDFYQPELTYEDQYRKEYQFNQNTNLMIPEGKEFVIRASATDFVGEISCKIAGERAILKK